MSAHEQPSDAPREPAARRRPPDPPDLREVDGAIVAATHVSARERFDSLELSSVLSHYDLGVIESIKDFPRGSSRSPKVVFKCDRGVFLLKRRGPGRDDPQKVGFTHQVQSRLERARLPVPRLIATRDGDTMLAFEGHIYELFEFVQSTGYDGGAEATAAAGQALARFHRAVAGHRPDWTPPSGGYHNAARILPHLLAIPERVPSGRTPGVELGPVTEILRDAYAGAAERADGAGLPSWPRQIIHGDWHPGNLLFRGPRVVAMLDFDAARVEPRVLDIANGALQFSIVMKGEDPDTWPDALDEDRLLAFCRGYDGESGCRIASAEIDALTPLMVEALVVEAVIPIAATGSFARIEGGAFIRMVERKVRWMQDNAARLAERVARGA